MRSALLACLALIAAGCGATESGGRVALRLRFAAGVQPAHTVDVLELRLKIRWSEAPGRAAGQIQASAPLSDDQLVVGGVPFGSDNRATVVVVDQSEITRYRGESTPFEVMAGQDSAVGLLLIDGEGWICDDPQHCQPSCGDGLVRGEETCDDGNPDDGDGCDGHCHHERGQLCGGEPSSCVAVSLQSVPEGILAMGCDPDADYYCDPWEQNHAVQVPAFDVDTTEVTVAQYRGCVRTRACGPPQVGIGCHWGKLGRDGHPINCVSWWDADRFCSWAGKRLCTEAEWERAARGDDGRTYPWGEATPDCDLAVIRDGDRFGCGSSFLTWSVSQLPQDGASPFGVIGMAGNISEWVADCYEESYIGAPVDGSARQDCPTSDDSMAVLRGGNFATPAESSILRAFHRLSEHKVNRQTYLGIRCCQDPLP